MGSRNTVSGIGLLRSKASIRVLIAAFAFTVPSARAQVTLASLNYESPALIAPALLHLRPAGDGNITLSLVGWTLGADLRLPATPSRDWGFTLEATPLNAHRSDAVYEGGEVDPDSAFRNSTWQAKAGLKLRHRPDWTGEYRAVLLHERISGRGDGGLVGMSLWNLRHRWESPFAGLEMNQAMERVRGFDPIRNRWDGWKASAGFQVYGGSRTWWRGNAQFGLGRKIGGLFLRGGGTLFLGDDLDAVSRPLVGGGWELPGLHPLPGYRYGELRVEEGLLASVGADWTVAGPLEAGMRAGHLSQRNGRDYGTALRVAWQLPESSLSLGWAVRGNPLDPDGLSRSVVSASWAAALWTPFGVD